MNESTGKGARQFFFVNSSGEKVSSTEFAKDVLSRAVEAIDPELALSIRAEANWRKNYQRYFLAAGRLEFADKNAGFDISSQALQSLGGQIVDGQGSSLASLAKAGFSARNQVHTVRIKGDGAAQRYWPQSNDALAEVAAAWADRGLAEHDVVSAFEFLHRNPNLPIADDLLIALAGNAELAASRDWLSLGGRVAVIARPNQIAWRELIAHARKSAGELFIAVDAPHPMSASISDEQLAEVAGINFVDNIDLAASWVHELSRNENRVVLASYAYVGGSKQIIAQAAQDAIIAVASENIPKSKLALSYLATPLDIVVADETLADKQFAAYDIRSAFEKFRDALARPFGQLLSARPEVIRAVEHFTIFDASSVRQGSSYLLAKHSEKWRALVAARQGNLVSFTVAPPATTRSVLGVKILEKTYRGLGRFGVLPFEAAYARRAMALIMLRNLHDENSIANPKNSATNRVALVSATAIHGGIWRSGYHPDSIWVMATLLGWLSK